MRWFRTWLAGTPRRRPSSPTRPTVERLEDRRLLTSVSYHGGSLLANVGVETVYFGPQWSGTAQGQQNVQQLDTFVGMLVNSPYLDQLSTYSNGSYHIGRGTLLDHDVTTTGWVLGTNVVTETMIQSMLNTDIVARGTLRKPDANRLYVVYLPPGMISQYDQQAPAVGHHSSFHDASGFTINYAVIPDQSTAGVPLGALPGLTPFQQQTWVTSHELAEAVTDPTDGGWWSNANGDEIGDIPQRTLPVGTVDGNLYGYDLQKEWIQSAQASLLPSGLPGWPGSFQPTTFRSVTQATNQDGAQQEFALAANGVIWTRLQPPGVTGWGDWISLGSVGPFGAGSLEVGKGADGRLQLYALALGIDGSGIGNNLWTATQTTPGTLGAWTNLGRPSGNSLASLAVALNANGLPQVFAVGTNHTVWIIGEFSFQPIPNVPPHVAWGGWTSLGDGVLSISVVRDAANRLEVFALGTDNAVYWTRRMTANGTTWIPWSTLGGNFQSVTVGRNADLSLEVFALRFDGAVWTMSQTGPLGSWNNWMSLGGNVRSIVLGSNRDGRLEVFAVGQDYQVYAIAQTAPSESAAWTWWFGLGGTADTLSVGNLSDGRLQIAALNALGRVSVATQVAPDGGWN
jgi:hypothetical protein